MTEEIKEEKQEKFVLSPDLKQFLLTILASFLGCLVALCLYSSAVKPKFKHCPPPPPRFEAVRHFDGYQAIPPKRDFRPDRPHHKHHRLDAPSPMGPQSPLDKPNNQPPAPKA